MIRTVGYIVLMHHRSPVAWLGHKRKWMRLREGQRRLYWARAFPGHYPAVTWMQVMGLEKFAGGYSKREIRYNQNFRIEFAKFYVSGWFGRQGVMWRTWLYPYRYVVQSSEESSRPESLAI